MIKLITIKNIIISPWAFIILVPLMVLIFDPDQAGHIVTSAIKSLATTFPYILFAVFLIAFLKAAGAEALIANAFKGRENKMIILAAIFGGLAPFCSCQVIPFVAGLLAVGAPLSAVMAFWLSSPLIDPPTLLITAGALGWTFAIAKAVAAISLGLLGGYIIKSMRTAGFFANPVRVQSKGGCASSPFQGKPVWKFWQEKQRRSVFGTELVNNLMFLTKWLALAYIFEALLITYVPASLIVSAVGGEGVGPIITAAVIGMPAYLNGYVAPPLLAGLIEQGMTPGAAMAFIIAGSVSSIPAMTAVYSLVKRSVFFTYLGLGVGGAIISGIIFQLFT